MYAGPQIAEGRSIESLLSEVRLICIVWGAISAGAVIIGCYRKSLLIISIGVHHFLPMITMVLSVSMATNLTTDNLVEWLV